jgi:predicted metalloenzyme YecM
LTYILKLNCGPISSPVTATTKQVIYIKEKLSLQITAVNITDAFNNYKKRRYYEQSFRDSSGNLLEEKFLRGQKVWLISLKSKVQTFGVMQKFILLAF